MQQGPGSAAEPLLDEQATPRLLAFYLPQFHAIPENDAFWGPGFTEWTNLVRAKPQFRGHRQPRLPSELGFYDLSEPEVQAKQAALAKEHGVFGFCYYYFWFQGHRVLEGPLELMLRTPSIDMPFCLCYANQSWTRRWDGQEQARLLSQHHTAEDDVTFIRSVIPFMRDARYVRVEGRPLLLVYRTALYPDMARTVERWRRVCRDEGVKDPFLVRSEAFGDRTLPESLGFDASYEFPPNDLHLDPMVVEPLGDFSGTVYDYRLTARAYQSRKRPWHRFFRCVAPSWDNTPRYRERALVLTHSTPNAYFDWLSFALDDSLQNDPVGSRLVFINAWNEWGEGAHLEPCAQYGRAYLEATRDALRACTPQTAPTVAAALKQRLRGESVELAELRAELERLRRGGLGERVKRRLRVNGQRWVRRATGKARSWFPR